MSSFGIEFEGRWPSPGAVLMEITEFGRNLLEKCKKVEKPFKTDVKIQDFMKKSSDFPIQFGTNTCRVLSQPVSRHPEIQKQIASAYPVIHERVLTLYLAFLEHKCQFGTKLEKDLYTQMSLIDLVQRLLTKRCVSFFGKNDKYFLLERRQGCGGFMDVGKDSEKPPLQLANVLSYDEIKLSALLSVSSHSEFINDGNRNNCGKVETNKSAIEPSGVVIGLIGARLSRRFVMEYQDIIITKAQNTLENGYGLKDDDPIENPIQDYRRLWKKFYEENDFIYDNVTKDNERFGSTLKEGDIFDNLIMKKRYTISFDTLLLDAEARAAEAQKQAYIHVVGIGLGVWKKSEQQEKIFLETFTQRLKVLLPKLAHIGVVHFSWFHLTEWGDLKHGGILKHETHPQGGIRTFLSKRNPADKLKMPEEEDMLLIVSYAWDGNALPGNEFWMNMLSSTGDPSTACSTLISELHNPHINDTFVNGSNLHIASEKYGLLHISDYVNQMLDKQSD